MAGLARVGFDLLAQMADVRLDEAAIPLVAEAPDVGDDLAGGTDVVRVDRQQMQQLAFRGGQAPGFAVYCDGVVQRVYSQRPQGDDGGGALREAGAATAANGANACQYLRG